MRHGAVWLAFCLAFATCILHRAPTTHAQQAALRLQAEWREIEYEFPSEAEQQRTRQTLEYVPGNGVSIDLDVDFNAASGRRVFVTVPRFVGGIPITLGTLTDRLGARGNPLIRAYPSYAANTNQGSNCNGLTSVFRVAIDECRRLWVLDSGKVGDTQNCPPQLVVFDLDTDTIIRQHKFPEAMYKVGSSLFITPVVDVRDATPATAGQCPNTMVYVADVNGFGLIVYDFLNDASWRVQNKFIYASPHAGTFTLAGESFDLMDGLFGMAVSPMQSAGRRRRDIGMHSHMNRFPSQYAGQFNGFRLDNIQPTKPARTERMLYFHALAGTSEIAVPLRIVDNSSMWLANIESVPRSFVELGNRGAQATAEAMDSNGNLFFGLISPIAIGCWDSTQRTFGRDTMRVVAQNDVTLQFSSGLKIKRNPSSGREELWVMSCRFQKVMTNTMSTDEVNFRIQMVEVNTLLGGKSRCTPSSRTGGMSSGDVLFPVS